MRAAVVADVHGNLPALEAVAAAIAADGVDLVVNCGDLLSGAVAPAATASALIDLGWVTLAGNHDRWLLTTPRSQMGSADAIAADELGDAHWSWLRSLTPTMVPFDGALAFHGTPTDDNRYLTESIDGARVRAATAGEVVSRLARVPEAGLLLCGHTHVARSLVLPDGRFVVNPGSVGWPAYDDDQPSFHVVETGSPDARYAIVDDASGVWSVDFRSVSYDHEAAAALAERNGRPEIAHALRTGLVPR